MSLSLNVFLQNFFLCGAVAVLSVGCTWTAPVQPAILVIAVENLGFDAFSCREEQSTSASGGLEALCEESVRFTHAYTPSTMSQATMASLLTGQYPHEHGVHHNGAQALKAASETAAELALSRGFDTSFFSGGPPVFRRSGIHQGFQTFDDILSLSIKKVYRTARETSELFFSWLDLEAGDGKFFSFIYFADGQFTDLPAADDLGELRESSYRGQVEEIDEALGRIIFGLKKRKLWDSTTVILTGLNGYESEIHPDEMMPLNLYSESTHVALMIKPARKKRDAPIQWKIDANVSLVDVGVTIFDLLGVKRPSEGLAKVSLRSALEGPQPTWDENRVIVSESAWAEWRAIGGTRVAARRGPYLFINDDPSGFYNTLTDSLETSQIRPEALGADADLQRGLQALMQQLGYIPWRVTSTNELERFALGHELWRSAEPDRVVLQRLKSLSEKNSRDEVLSGWRAILALRRGDWKDLEKLATARPDRQRWLYVARRGLGKKQELPNDPCLLLAVKANARTPAVGECRDDAVRLLAILRDDTLPELERSKTLEAFIKAYSNRALNLRIARLNYVTGLKWDTDLNLLRVPDSVDLILALPEFRRVRSAVRARLSLEK